MTGTGSEQGKRWEPIRSQRQRWKKSCSFRLHTTRFAILMFGTVSFQCFPSSRPRRHACSGIIRGTEMLMPAQHAHLSSRFLSRFLSRMPSRLFSCSPTPFTPPAPASPSALPQAAMLISCFRCGGTQHSEGLVSYGRLHKA